MILFVHSTLDIAGVNIAKSLLQNWPFTKTEKTYQENPAYQAEIKGKQVNFIILNREAVNAQYLKEDFPNVELVVFLSRHSSQSGKPTLSVHTPGNFALAGLGGLPRTLSVAPAEAMQTVLKTMIRLKQEMNLNYEVSYECTHHGPSLNIPTMFTELGSSETQWQDSMAAHVVADSAIAAIENFSGKTKSAVIGIGGTHYNEKFTRMALAGEAIFGHMIPKYAISTIDSEMLTQCIQKTLETVSLALLDWKGIASQDKPKLLSALAEANLPFKKV